MDRFIKLFFLALFLFNTQKSDAQLLTNLNDKLKNTQKEIENIQFPNKKANNKQVETKERLPSEKEIEVKGNNSTSIAFEKDLIFPSPNPRLQSIEIQAYKGLPRLGVINSNGLYEQGVTSLALTGVKKNIKDYEQRKLLTSKLSEARTNYINYFLLLEMQLLKEHYKNMYTKTLVDVDVKHNITALWHKADQEGAIPQAHLKEVAKQLTTKDSYPIYFCGEEEYCKKSNQRKEKFWGGAYPSEFEQVRSFKSFVDDNLEDLKKWANTLSTDAYLVTSIKFDTYNFEKQGFPIKYISARSNNHTGEFNPIQDFEMPNRNSNKLYLLKMASEKAQEFLKNNSRRTLLAVFKIKFTKVSDPKQVIQQKSSIRMFNLSSPIIEIYQDEGLIVKVGEFDLKNILEEDNKISDEKSKLYNSKSNDTFKVGEKVKYISKRGNGKISELDAEILEIIKGPHQIQYRIEFSLGSRSTKKFHRNVGGNELRKI